MALQDLRDHVQACLDILGYDMGEDQENALKDLIIRVDAILKSNEPCRTELSNIFKDICYDGKIYKLFFDVPECCCDDEYWCEGCRDVERFKPDFDSFQRILGNVYI